MKMRLLILVFGQLIYVNCLWDTESALLSRQKRFLIWQPGTNWVQMVAGIGLPTELQDTSVTMGVVVKSYYLLPTNSSEYLYPSLTYARKKRSISRWQVYSILEKFIESFGYSNGRVCILRAICEASAIPFDHKTGILAEILHVLLTPSTTKEEEDHHSDLEYHAAENIGKEVSRCENLFKQCDANFMSDFTRIFM